MRALAGRPASSMQAAYLSTLFGVSELFGAVESVPPPGAAAEAEVGEAGGVERLQQLGERRGLAGALNVCSWPTLVNVTSSSSAASTLDAVSLRSAVTVSRRRIWSSTPV